MKQQVTDFLLYRWRYIIGISVGTIVVLCVLLFTSLLAPGGLRAAEQASSIASDQLSFMHFDPQTVVNLPYHLLQKLSFSVFGVTQLSIKLPSLLFGIIGIIGIYMLIKTWFRRKIAIIMTIITSTIPVFMFMTQDGTPFIYSFAVSVWLLTTGTFISRRYTPHILWKIIFLILLALNLYTPLGIYLNIAIISTLIFHPHIRHLARKFNPNRVAIATGIGLLVLIPLIFSLINQPKLILQLLGIPGTMPTLTDNASQLLSTFAGFSASNNALIQPMFSVPILILLILGLIRLIRVKYTARSYIIWLWGLLLAPIILLSPEYAPYTLVLAVIVITMGFDGLIYDWYKLFPLNPYARVGGLIPLGLIVLGIVVGNSISYGLGYKYAPGTLESFNNDLILLDQAIESQAHKPEKSLVIVQEHDRAFYELVAKRRDNLQIATPNNAPNQLNSIVHRGAKDRLANSAQNLKYIVVNARKNDAGRFFVYGQ
jgi:4-amino-4-deoxy-L-arabinose transferase-like glycosyltransferase